MAAELGLLSLTQLQLQKLAESKQNTTPNSWMWNPKQTQEADDSWEVRAFEEDTGNIMGTTWPPRSYTCTFCRREFRSAQALGGHMNVHRRDRARLHQTPPASSSTSGLIIPAAQDQFSANAGVCLVYQLPNPNGVFTPATMNACTPSTLLSISPYPVASPIINSSHFFTNKAQTVGSVNNNSNKDLENEELDLELRLGHRSTSSSSSSYITTKLKE